jgi:hypothetical protein
MRKGLSILFFIFLFNPLFAQHLDYVHLASPDGRIVFAFEIESGLPVYSVLFKGKYVIESASLNLDLNGIGKIRNAFYAQRSVYKEINETYKLTVAKLVL